MPKRIQRSRKKGWRMPAGAVYVGRPGKWGNPYRCYSNKDAVDLYARLLNTNPYMRDLAKQELRGKDLACWCKIGNPCHADILLEVANRK